MDLFGRNPFGTALLHFSEMATASLLKSARPSMQPLSFNYLEKPITIPNCFTAASASVLAWLWAL